jgi:hypothetical protein
MEDNQRFVDCDKCDGSGSFEKVVEGYVGDRKIQGRKSKVRCRECGGTGQIDLLGIGIRNLVKYILCHCSVVIFFIFTAFMFYIFMNMEQGKRTGELIVALLSLVVTIVLIIADVSTAWPKTVSTFKAIRILQQHDRQNTGANIINDNNTVEINNKSPLVPDELHQQLHHQ